MAPWTADGEAQPRQRPWGRRQGGVNGAAIPTVQAWRKQLWGDVQSCDVVGEGTVEHIETGLVCPSSYPPQPPW